MAKLWSMKCLRRLWENEDNGLALKGKEIPLKVQQESAMIYSDHKGRGLCHRMSMAGLSVSLMIQDLDSDSLTRRFETPDDERAGSCHTKNGDARGLRPRCWFLEQT